MLKQKLFRAFRWRFYPGICIGVRSDKEVETYSKDGFNFTLQFNSHTLMIPMFECGIETGYCIDGLKDYMNLKNQTENE